MGDFTVNIALVEDGKSIGGVIYVPVSGELFSAWNGVAYKNGEKLLAPDHQGQTVAGVSHFHKGKRLQQFLDQNNIENVRSVGSSLKFCRLAEGLIHIYPRLSPTSQWDIAAGHAIAEAAGCKIVRYPDREALSYGGTEIINPDFVAFHADVEWTPL